jgi:hypothetical protein
LEDAARRQSAQEIYQILRKLRIGFEPGMSFDAGSFNASHAGASEPCAPRREET